MHVKSCKFIEKQGDAMLLIKNGILHTMERRGVIQADLLAKNGKIVCISERIDPPESARILDARRLHIYPGFIDAHSHIGISEEKSGAARRLATDTLIIPYVFPSNPFTSGSTWIQSITL